MQSSTVKYSYFYWLKIIIKVTNPKFSIGVFESKRFIEPGYFKRSDEDSVFLFRCESNKQVRCQSFVLHGLESLRYSYFFFCSWIMLTVFFFFFGLSTKPRIPSLTCNLQFHFNPSFLSTLNCEHQRFSLFCDRSLFLF